MEQKRHEQGQENGCLISFPVEYTMERVDDALESDSLTELENCEMWLESQITELDNKEPADEESEAYDEWADCHEELEDLLDEVRDQLDALREQ